MRHPFILRASLLAPAGIVLASAILCLHFLEDFPNGWDQTEYSRCLADNQLPHSPYLLHFAAGKLFACLWDPPLALALVSLAAGLLSCLAFHEVVRRLLVARVRAGTGEAEARSVALIATALLAGSYVFIRQSATQEVYSFQLLWLLLPGLALLSAIPGRAVVAGLLFGAALAAHNSSLFALPSLVVLLFATSRKSSLRSAAGFLGGGVAVYLACAVFVFLTLPPLPERSQFTLALAYLRGVSPPPFWDTLLSPSTLFASTTQMIERLVDTGRPLTRVPVASGPTGLHAPWLLLAGGGAILCWPHRSRIAARHWMLHCAPFLLYEIALKKNLDWGIYLPFVLPSTCFFAAQALVRTTAGLDRIRARRLVAPVRLVLVGMLLGPSFLLVTTHWNDPEIDRRAHFSSTTVAAMLLPGILPRNAVVVQPSSEWNGNILPYYCDRQHILRLDGYLLLFVRHGAFQPMNHRYYKMLTNRQLRLLLAAERPVYALEPRPLQHAPNPMLSEEPFLWVPVRTVRPTGDEPELRRLSARDLERVRTEEPIVLYEARMASGEVASKK